MPNVREARTRKTKMYFENREEFLRLLDLDLKMATKQAEKAGLIPCVRLNVASDIAWEILHSEIFENHPKIQFYDYSKWTDHRFDQALASDTYKGRFAMPANYHLTYSHNENTPEGFTENLLAAGVNVAVVFDTEYSPSVSKVGKLPTSWRGFDVIDGDDHDIRLREFDNAQQSADDARGVVVGLRGKGGKRQVVAGVDSGFIMPTIGGVAEKHSFKVAGARVEFGTIKAKVFLSRTINQLG